MLLLKEKAEQIKKLLLANNKTEELTIKKLTRGNPTTTAKFESL